MKALARLQREWDARLKADGFEDLEGHWRDGPLSDRGNLHPVAETREEDERLANRIQDGQAFTSWAEDVLHAHRFSSPEEREAWRLHASGLSEVAIAAELGHSSRNPVRRHLAAVRARVTKVTKVTKQWRSKKQRRALIRKCDPEMLAKLAALLTQTRRAT